MITDRLQKTVKNLNKHWTGSTITYKMQPRLFTIEMPNNTFSITCTFFIANARNDLGKLCPFYVFLLIQLMYFFTSVSIFEQLDYKALPRQHSHCP